MKIFLFVGLTFFALASQAKIYCPAYVIKGQNYLDDKAEVGAVLSVENGLSPSVEINGENITLFVSRNNDTVTINMQLGTDWIWTVLKKSVDLTKSNYEYYSSFYQWPGVGLPKFDFINPIEKNGFGYLQLSSGFIEVLQKNNLYGIEPFRTDRILSWDLDTATEYIRRLIKKGVITPEQLLFFGPTDFCWENKEI